MKTLGRILEESGSGSKGGLNEVESRTLIGCFIFILLIFIYCLLWLFMGRCGGSPTCQNDMGRGRTRSRAYRRVLEALPVIKYTITSLEAETCAICLTEYEEGDLVRVLPRCSHKLHMECLDVWLLRSFKCPICRALVTQITVDVHGDTMENQDRRISEGYVCPPMTSVVVTSLL